MTTPEGQRLPDRTAGPATLPHPPGLSGDLQSLALAQPGRRVKQRGPGVSEGDSAGVGLAYASGFSVSPLTRRVSRGGLAYASGFRCPAHASGFVGLAYASGFKGVPLRVGFQGGLAYASGFSGGPRSRVGFALGLAYASGPMRPRLRVGFQGRPRLRVGFQGRPGYASGFEAASPLRRGSAPLTRRGPRVAWLTRRGNDRLINNPDWRRRARRDRRRGIAKKDSAQILHRSRRAVRQPTWPPRRSLSAI